MSKFRILEDRVTAEMFIFGFIGDEGLTSKDFTDTLHEAESAGAKNFLVRINSGGGDVFEAIAIYNALYQRNTTTCIEGLAASAASFIAMAGKTIKMWDNAFVMIHNPWTFAAGDGEYFKRVQEQLDMIKETLIKAYSRTGLSRDEIIAMMDAETWLNADDCKEKKFADEIIQTGATQQPVNSAMRQFYAQIFSTDQRKVKTMLSIMSALGLPAGSTESQIVAAIDNLKVKNTENESKLKASENVLAGVKAELDQANQKVTDLETKESKRQGEEEEKQFEAALQLAIKDKRVMPAVVDATTEAGKSIRDGYKNAWKKNNKVFDSFPVLSAAPSGSQAAQAVDANDREALDAKIKAYMKTNNVQDYATALSAVLNQA